MPGTRIRSLKPEFHTSPSTARASLRARLLYQVLWHLANDYGYGETNLLVILGHAFPPSDEVTVDDLGALLREIAVAYDVVFYEVRGRHYYWIPSWDKHNRKPNSKSRQWYPVSDTDDSVPDLRFCVSAQQLSESCGEFPELPGGSCGAVELGNRGAGGELPAVVATSEPPTDVDHSTNDNPPPPCSKHPQGNPDGEPCGGCADARRARQQWEAEQSEAERTDRKAIRTAIDNCTNGCDEYGRLDDMTYCPEHANFREYERTRS
jgi:hypothetical protein